MLPSRCLLQPICMFLLVGLLRYLPAPKLKSFLATESPLLSRNLAYLAQCSCSDSLLLVISSKFLQLVVAAVAEKRGEGRRGSRGAGAAACIGNDCGQGLVRLVRSMRWVQLTSCAVASSTGGAAGAPKFRCRYWWSVFGNSFPADAASCATQRKTWQTNAIADSSQLHGASTASKARLKVSDTT